MKRFEQHTIGTRISVSRRGVLRAAALGTGGLALIQAALAEEGGGDRGKPGDGGYGRDAVQLSPGAKVAVHDPKDIEYARVGSLSHYALGGR